MLGTAGALLAAGGVHWYTGSPLAAAFAGTWGENLGYYGLISYREVRDSLRRHQLEQRTYGPGSFLRNVRDLVLEFGVAELLDSFVLRPFFMYTAPLALESFAMLVTNPAARAVKIPREFIFVNRWHWGLNAVLASLRASSNFHRIVKDFV